MIPGCPAFAGHDKPIAVANKFKPLSKCSFEPLRCLLLGLGADMRRREFLGVLGSAAAWPVVVQAQQTSKPVIGFLAAPAAMPFAQRTGAIHQGLREASFVEGQNVTIEYRWADG